jgi:hypothetical protein
MTRRPDELILIAVWEFITAAGALIGMSALFIFVFPEVRHLYGVDNVAAVFGLSIAVIFLFFTVSLAVVAGIGLLTGKEWGRVMSVVYATFSLLRIPFGTIIGILVIIYLVKPQIREYFESTKKEQG